MCLSLAKHRVRLKCQNSTLLHTRTDSHLLFFRPPNVDQTGGEREDLCNDKSGVKSRFLVLLLKNYTNIALTRLTQVCPKAFYQLDIAFFALS